MTALFDEQIEYPFNTILGIN